MRLDELREALQAQKGKRTLPKIARASDMHADTLYRIMRGTLKNPGVLAVEKIEAALKEIEQ